MLTATLALLQACLSQPKNPATLRHAHLHSCSKPRASTSHSPYTRAPLHDCRALSTPCLLPKPPFCSFYTSTPKESCVQPYHMH